MSSNQTYLGITKENYSLQNWFSNSNLKQQYISEARFKARLVCGGHRQTSDDYEEIFSPVVRFTTIRTLLALTALNNWSTAQFDVECAFLNAPLKEEVYIRIPDGCSQLMPKGMTTENGVLKILKAVYGLKQLSLIHISEPTRPY